MASNIRNCENGNQHYSKVSKDNAQHISSPEHKEHVLKQKSAGSLHIHCITNFITNYTYNCTSLKLSSAKYLYFIHVFYL